MESFLFNAVLVFAGLLLAVVVYFKYSYTYWKKKGVPFLEPSFPYGNYMYAFSRAPTFAGETKVWYNKLKEKGYKFGGVWMFARPLLILVDPDYIRDILTKDFNHFIDRDIFVNEKWDPQGTHLFNISSNGWKPLRQKLTPTFTSGKMKTMFNSVLNCSNPMVEYLNKCVKIGDDINIKEVLASFTTDVIFCVALGVDCNSFSDTDTEFRRQGRELFRFSIGLIPKMVMIRSFPGLSKMLGLQFGKKTTKHFFGEVVKQTMEYRRKNNVKKSDFLQLLIDMNENTKDKEKPFTFDEIVANTLLFFVADLNNAEELIFSGLTSPGLLELLPDVSSTTTVDILKGGVVED